MESEIRIEDDEEKNYRSPDGSKKSDKVGINMDGKEKTSGKENTNEKNLINNEDALEKENPSREEDAPEKVEAANEETVNMEDALSEEDATQKEDAEKINRAEEAALKSDDDSETDNVHSDKKDLQIASLNDRYLRLLAEFDNFRKRNEAEKSLMFTEGEKTVILKILPLIDNFERALSSVPKEDEGTGFMMGIEKVYKAFISSLKELGVNPIEALGKEFDASIHSAVMHVEDKDLGKNLVIEEFQKGYLFQDKVIRYAMVKVAN